MMSALDRHGSLVISTEIGREAGPFTCSECGKEARMEDGEIITFLGLPPRLEWWKKERYA
jgi:hypothetical protein